MVVTWTAYKGRKLGESYQNLFPHSPCLERDIRYMDSLVGPYPAFAAVYKERAPINAVDRISCPLVLFHGAEDKSRLAMKFRQLVVYNTTKDMARLGEESRLSCIYLKGCRCWWRVETVQTWGLRLTAGLHYYNLPQIQLGFI